MSALTDFFATQYPYVLSVLLVGIGLYVVVGSQNLVKKVIGLNVFQTGLFLFFVSSAFVEGGSSPVLHGHGGTHASPLPQVLVLTAIVVGVALTAVAMALLIRIYNEYGTLQEDVLREVRPDE